MNERQLIAIRNPCATPDETVAEAFRRAVWISRTTFVSTILSVNK